MKSSLVILLVFISFSLFAQPVPVTIRPLQDYYFYSDEELDKGINYKVLSSRKEMDKLFGKTDRPDTPDFSKELMLVMVMPATKKDVKLGFKRLSMTAGEFIEVYCDNNLKGHFLTYEFNPIAVAIIPRPENTTVVHFYDDRTRTLMDTVRVKN